MSRPNETLTHRVFDQVQLPFSVLEISSITETASNLH